MGSSTITSSASSASGHVDKNSGTGLSLLQKAIGNNANADESWLQALYAAQVGAGAEKDAAPVLEKLTRRNPGRREYWLQLAGLYYKAGKGRLLTIVLVRDSQGQRPDQMFYATCLDWSVRHILATYANRFDDYSGEKFEVLPEATPASGGVIVQTRLVKGNGEPVTLNYLMRQSGDKWQIIDVFLSGTISELATRRSEFTSILRRDGPDGLLQVLDKRVADLKAS